MDIKEFSAFMKFGMPLNGAFSIPTQLELYKASRGIAEIVKMSNKNKDIDNHVVDDHENIMHLFERLHRDYSESDYSGLLHTACSIIETLAKDIINNPNLKDKSLGSFMESYRKHTSLSDHLFKFVEELYRRRSCNPLSAHGSLEKSNLNRADAIEIIELTKAIVNIERKNIKSKKREFSIQQLYKT